MARNTVARIPEKNPLREVSSDFGDKKRGRFARSDQQRMMISRKPLKNVRLKPGEDNFDIRLEYKS